MPDLIIKNGEFSEKIQTLLKEAGKQYASKNFEKSSEIYAEICELYNTDTQEDNENLMFLYGKSLFQLAVSNSEVLGGSSSSKKKSSDVDESEEIDIEDRSETTENSNEAFKFDDGVVEEDEEEDEEDSEEKADTDDIYQEKENVEDEEEDKANREEEEQINDFEESWTILDIARTLFEKKLDSLKLDQKEDSSEFLQVKKKLSEAYDILGEVSLESENYMQASQDFKMSLDLRKEIFEFEKQNEQSGRANDDQKIDEYSALISESYYKLSLALEFLVDVPGSRKQAADCMRLAIETVKMRDRNEKDSESQSILAELQERLEDLQKDPLKEEKEKIMKDLLGNGLSNGTHDVILGTSSGGNDEKKAIVNDLTGSIVKKRKGPKIMKPSSVKKTKQK